MATIAQLDKQIQTATITRDALVKKVNDIENKIIILNKQLSTANSIQRATISKQIGLLKTQKAIITGSPDIQATNNPNATLSPVAEDGEVDVVMAPSAAITTATAGNVSSVGGEGNFPMRWGVGKRNSRVNANQMSSKNENVYKYVDKLGSVIDETI